MSVSSNKSNVIHPFVTIVQQVLQNKATVSAASTASHNLLQPMNDSLLSLTQQSESKKQTTLQGLATTHGSTLVSITTELLAILSKVKANTSSTASTTTPIIHVICRTVIDIIHILNTIQCYLGLKSYDIERLHHNLTLRLGDYGMVKESIEQGLLLLNILKQYIAPVSIASKTESKKKKNTTSTTNNDETAVNEVIIEGVPFALPGSGVDSDVTVLVLGVLCTLMNCYCQCIESVSVEDNHNVSYSIMVRQLGISVIHPWLLHLQQLYSTDNSKCDKYYESVFTSMFKLSNKLDKIIKNINEWSSIGGLSYYILQCRVDGLCSFAQTTKATLATYMEHSLRSFLLYERRVKDQNSQTVNTTLNMTDTKKNLLVLYEKMCDNVITKLMKQDIENMLINPIVIDWLEHMTQVFISHQQSSFFLPVLSSMYRKMVPLKKSASTESLLYVSTTLLSTYHTVCTLEHLSENEQLAETASIKTLLSQSLSLGRSLMLMLKESVGLLNATLITLDGENPWYYCADQRSFWFHKLIRSYDFIKQFYQRYSASPLQRSPNVAAASIPSSTSFKLSNFILNYIYDYIMLYVDLISYSVQFTVTPTTLPSICTDAGVSLSTLRGPCFDGYYVAIRLLIERDGNASAATLVSTLLSHALKFTNNVTEKRWIAVTTYNIGVYYYSCNDFVLAVSTLVDAVTLFEYLEKEYNCADDQASKRQTLIAFCRRKLYKDNKDKDAVKDIALVILRQCREQKQISESLIIQFVKLKSEMIMDVKDINNKEKEKDSTTINPSKEKDRLKHTLWDYMANGDDGIRHIDVKLVRDIVEFELRCYRQYDSLFHLDQLFLIQVLLTKFYLVETSPILRARFLIEKSIVLFRQSKVSSSTTSLSQISIIKDAIELIKSSQSTIKQRLDVSHSSEIGTWTVDTLATAYAWLSIYYHDTNHIHECVTCINKCVTLWTSLFNETVDTLLATNTVQTPDHSKLLSQATSIIDHSKNNNAKIFNDDLFFVPLDTYHMLHTMADLCGYLGHWPQQLLMLKIITLFVTRMFQSPIRSPSIVSVIECGCARALIDMSLTYQRLGYNNKSYICLNLAQEDIQNIKNTNIDINYSTIKCNKSNQQRQLLLIESYWNLCYSRFHMLNHEGEEAWNAIVQARDCLSQRRLVSNTSTNTLTTYTNVFDDTIMNIRNDLTMSSVLHTRHQFSEALVNGLQAFKRLYSMFPRSRATTLECKSLMTHDDNNSNQPNSNNSHNTNVSDHNVELGFNPYVLSMNDMNDSSWSVFHCLCDLLHHLGNFYESHGLPREAIHYYDQGRSFSRLISSPMMCVRFTSLLAEIEAKRRHWSVAETLIQEAITMHDESYINNQYINNDMNISYIYDRLQCRLRLGDILLAQGRLADAMIAYDDTHSLLLKIMHPMFLKSYEIINTMDLIIDGTPREKYISTMQPFRLCIIPESIMTSSTHESVSMHVDVPLDALLAHLLIKRGILYFIMQCFNESQQLLNESLEHKSIPVDRALAHLYLGRIELSKSPLRIWRSLTIGPPTPSVSKSIIGAANSVATNDENVNVVEMTPIVRRGRSKAGTVTATTKKAATTRRRQRRSFSADTTTDIISNNINHNHNHNEVNDEFVTSRIARSHFEEAFNIAYPLAIPSLTTSVCQWLTLSIGRLDEWLTAFVSHTAMGVSLRNQMCYVLHSKIQTMIQKSKTLLLNTSQSSSTVSTKTVTTENLCVDMSDLKLTDSRRVLGSISHNVNELNNTAIKKNLCKSSNLSQKRDITDLDVDVMDSLSHLFEYGDHSLTGDAFRQLCQSLLPREWTVVCISAPGLHNSSSLTSFEGHGGLIITKIYDQAVTLGRLRCRYYHDNAWHTGISALSVLKSNFASIMSGNKETTSNSINVRTASQKSQWWNRRMALDSQLECLIDAMDSSIVGPWKGLLLGKINNNEILKLLNNMAEKLLPMMEAECAKGWCFDPQSWYCFFQSIDTLSNEDLKIGIMTLVGYFYDYDNSTNNIIPNTLLFLITTVKQSFYDCISEIISTSNQRIARHPVIFILDKSIQELPWENMSCICHHPITRVPCLSFLFAQCVKLQYDVAATGGERLIDPSLAFCLLNPSGDLAFTQSIFEKLLMTERQWSGITGTSPSAEVLMNALSTCDVFLYCGHGAGERYLSYDQVMSLETCPVVLLMGCASGRLTDRGDYEPIGMALSYIVAGAPAIVANLWEVTDKDIDKYSIKLLQTWFGGAGDGVTLADAVTQCRSECKLRYLNGAAPVCYGIPVRAKVSSQWCLT